MTGIISQSRTKADGTVDLITRCPWCQSETPIMVFKEELADWLAGSFTQDAFSTMHASVRELLQTGICPSCWEQTFAGEEDEGDGIS